jgi:hypothetical protein
MKTKEKAVPFRLPVDWLEALRELRSAIGISQQQMLEDATALYFGKRDPLAETRREMAISAMKSGKVRRPFNAPWPPSKDNALVC